MPGNMSNERLYDLTFLESMENADEEFVNTLKGVFISTTPPASKHMVEACIAGDWETAGKIAHKLKSSIDILNIASIRNDVKTIELSAKDRINLETLPALAKKVDEIIRMAAEQMEQDMHSV